MKIILKISFINRLANQVEYIAKDSPTRARKFNTEILDSVRNISHNPYQCRKSIYFNDKDIRDLIFKGYTIVFKINPDSIDVFGFVKFQRLPHD